MELSRKVQRVNTLKCRQSSSHRQGHVSEGDGWPAAGVGGIDSVSVVVNHDITEDDGLNLLHRKYLVFMW